MTIESLPEWQRVAVVAGVGLVVIGFGWAITSFLRAIAPSKHSRATDRRVLRLQRSFFLGHYPLGRFRTPRVESFIRANIVVVWVFVLLIIVLLIKAAL